MLLLSDPADHDSGQFVAGSSGDCSNIHFVLRSCGSYGDIQCEFCREILGILDPKFLFYRWILDILDFDFLSCGGILGILDRKFLLFRGMLEIVDPDCGIMMA